MNLKTKLSIGAIVLLSIGLSVFYFSWKYEKSERIRQERNVVQLTKSVDQSNMDLNLSRKEFSKMKTESTNRIDSVIKANNLKLSQVTEFYTLEIAYRDSVAKMAQMGVAEPIKPNTSMNVPESIGGSKTAFKIGFSQSDPCMFISGNVFTTDPSAKVQITEKGFKVIGDLFATRKRVLGFLWWKKPTDYVSVSSCGTVKYQHIKFK